MSNTVVVSSCSHDGPFGANGVKRLKDIMIDAVPGMKALDMNAADDAIVRLTREVGPGMIVTVMEVAEINGALRMGPTIGAMLISGQKAAHLALKSLKRCMRLEVLLSSCDHDGPFGTTWVKRLKDIMIDAVPGMNALDMNAADDAIVRLTREVGPGMIVTGMEVAEIDGAPRMGPTIGAMLISGQKAAHLALKALGRPNAIDGTIGTEFVYPELVLASLDAGEIVDA